MPLETETTTTTAAAAAASKKRKPTSSSDDNNNDVKNGTTEKKKSKLTKSTNGNNKNNNSNNEPNFNDDYDHLTLDKIRTQIIEICSRVPPPKIENETDDKSIREWAGKMQAVVEEFNLLISCVSAATYKWGADRSGAADQNLSLLSGELSSSQDAIANAVTHRLNNYLAPVVDMVVSRVHITRSSDENNKEEVRRNEYAREVVDTEFSKLCGDILCRNAKMLRHVVLANFRKCEKVLRDYIKATSKDNQQDRSFSY